MSTHTLSRLIVKRLDQRVIEAKIITGNNVGKRVFIPRIIMSPSGTDWPFVLHRQFPVRVPFVITINKSQGQTQQESRSDIQERWGIFGVSGLFPWSAVCCYFTGQK